MLLLEKIVDEINKLVIKSEKRSLTDEEKLGLLNRNQDELMTILNFLETQEEPELGHLY